MAIISKKKLKELGYEVMPFLGGFVVRKEVNGKNMYTGASIKWREEIEYGKPMMPVHEPYKTIEDAYTFIIRECQLKIKKKVK